MKRTLVTLLLTLVAMTQYGQLQQGSIMAAANINYSGGNDDDIDTAGTVTRNETNTGLDLNLRGGYFIADNFAIGLLVGYNSSREVTDNFLTPPAQNTRDEKGSIMYFGAFARMYKMLGESKFGVFGDVAFTFGTGNNYIETSNTNSAGTITSNKTTGKTNVIGVNLRPGISYFFSDRFAIEAMVGNIGLQTTGHKAYDDAGRLDGETKNTSTTVSLVPLRIGDITVGLTFFFGGGGGDSAK